MAKVIPGIIKVSGKLDNTVYTKDGKYGQQAKKAVVKGSKKEEAGLKEQYDRTPYLNKLAAEINRAIEARDNHLKSSDLYSRLHKLFRKEPLNNRFLLLKQLEGMEINPKYPMKRLAETEVTTSFKKNKFIVEVKAKRHSTHADPRFNCYFYEVLLLQWDDTDKESGKEVQLSDWVDMSLGEAAFDLIFPKFRSTQHWLLCIRQSMGIDRVQTNLLVSKGMQIISAGTFDKDDLSILEKRQKEMKVAKVLAMKEEEKVVRVKAKWVKPR